MRFDEAIRSYNFIKNEDEPCVYKKISGSAITFLALYVDDILLIGNDVGSRSGDRANDRDHPIVIGRLTLSAPHDQSPMGSCNRDRSLT